MTIRLVGAGGGVVPDVTIEFFGGPLDGQVTDWFDPVRPVYSFAPNRMNHKYVRAGTQVVGRPVRYQYVGMVTGDEAMRGE
jgi:hypothetical protein